MKHCWATRCIDRTGVAHWLSESSAERLGELWREADRVRHRRVGDQVHLRGLVEISNHCIRQCAYCGLRAANARVVRYRMTAGEILDSAGQALRLGYGTVVLQAGEDYGITAAWMAEVIRAIKGETGLAVTLSLGERRREELALWREAGADRYLLRFETSNRRLYERIHPTPAGRDDDRFTILAFLRALGYETGSGVMVGIPGQTIDDLAEDILTFGLLDLDMIGIGPFIPHPMTPLAARREHDASQVPADELTTCKSLALTRIFRPLANIPATTALATLDRHAGWRAGLSCGANVIMPNLTPAKYRALYEIYPDKACIYDDVQSNHDHIMELLASLGRTPGVGRGDSPVFTARAEKARAGQEVQ
ncbi:[FeFe] hydrogenase H-cluster radical SAM maturase HydE [bacterium]|nr:[FeFe] hydrogenase H-cluster radical SAM maturase HydE [candidate division CSSED10-310 bacterium]